MRRSTPTALLAVAAVVALAACDVPTEAPILEQRWVLPVENTTIGVNDLLPSGVTADGGSFAVEVDAFQLDETLGQMCGAECQAADGLVAPKPAFQFSFEETRSLPTDVQGAVLESGTLQVMLTHDLGFDPIRPGMGNTGSLTVEIRDGADGDVVAVLRLDGATEAFPSGSTIQRSLDVGGSQVGATVVMEVTVDSPAGDPVQIDADAALTATGTPSPLLLSQATVAVGGRTVEVDPVEVDVADIDTEISDRIQQGTLLIQVSNPFGIAVSGDLVVEYPGGEIVKSLAIGAASSSTVSIDYTGDELRAFLGQSGVRLTGSTQVEAGAGSITVSPGQEMALEGSLDVIIRIGD